MWDEVRTFRAPKAESAAGAHGNDAVAVRAGVIVAGRTKLGGTVLPSGAGEAGVCR